MVFLLPSLRQYAFQLVSGLLVKRVMQSKVCQARSIVVSAPVRFILDFYHYFYHYFYLGFIIVFIIVIILIFIMGFIVFVLVLIGVLIAFIAVSSPFSPLFLSSLSNCLLGTSVDTERTHCFVGLLRMRLSPRH